MPRCLPRKLRLQSLLRGGILSLLVALFAASLCGAAPADKELKLVIVLTRHGVRSPLQANQVLGKYAAEPWPEWKVAPGILTPHGRQEMAMMGA
jgi:4-phytase/acid phosphatase